MNKALSAHTPLQTYHRAFYVSIFSTLLFTANMQSMQDLTSPLPPEQKLALEIVAQDLNRAANHGLLKEIDKLINEHGAPANGLNPHDTPLKWAIRAGLLATVIYLMEVQHADVTRTYGALAAVAEVGSPDIAHYLIIHGAVVHPRTYTGTDAELAVAQKYKSVAVERFLNNWLRSHYFENCPACAVNVNSPTGHVHPATNQTARDRVVAALAAERPQMPRTETEQSTGQQPTKKRQRKECAFAHKK